MPSKSYVVVHLDLDAPFPGFPKLGPILHWAQAGLKVLPSSSSGGDNLLSSTGATTDGDEDPVVILASYMGPAPPPLSAPHRYVFFLYEAAPAAEVVRKWAKPLPTARRLWASLDAWEAKLGLEGTMVAVNYYTSN